MNPSAGTSPGFVIEEAAEGQNLVVTGDWSPAATKILLSGAVDGLTLNYARGYRERSLDFLQQEWPVRRLAILARTIKDLTPVYSLASTLQSLSVETAPQAELDLRQLPGLIHLATGWEQVRKTIGTTHGLRRLFLMRYSEPNLRPLGHQETLEALVMKEGPQLKSLIGIDQLPALREIGLFGATRLQDISGFGDAITALKLRRLELQSCPRVETLDALANVIRLEFLNVSECGHIQSLRPLIALHELRILYLYSSTRILDGDLTPLMQLPHLTELRMQNRRDYRPSVREIQSHLPKTHIT
jgi:hypothetical protein